MTCEQAMELMSAMLDGELDPQLTDALNAHLETCPECKHLAETLVHADDRDLEQRTDCIGQFVAGSVRVIFKRGFHPVEGGNDEIGEAAK